MMRSVLTTSLGVLAVLAMVACGNRDAPPPPAAPGATPLVNPVAVPAPVPTPVPVAAPGVGAAGGQLTIGGSQANYGVRPVQGGFMPDPMPITMVSGAAAGNSVDIRQQNLGPGCVGVGTRQPDLIVNYANPRSMLRFYFQPNQRGDTALVINGPDGRWYCNDDAVGLNPEVTFNGPQAGQYDIWVASYRVGTNIPGVLNVSELTSRRPTP